LGVLQDHSNLTKVVTEFRSTSLTNFRMITFQIAHLVNTVGSSNAPTLPVSQLSEITCQSSPLPAPLSKYRTERCAQARKDRRRRDLTLEMRQRKRKAMLITVAPFPCAGQSDLSSPLKFLSYLPFPSLPAHPTVRNLTAATFTSTVRSATSLAASALYSRYSWC
jgi:hypothetical protein